MLLRRMLLVANLIAMPVTALAQAAEMPEWQKAAGGKMEFDVASVRLDTGDFKPPSIAMSNDDGSQPRDGLFHADYPLYVDIEFAYKISLAPEQQEAMLAAVPRWVEDGSLRDPGALAGDRPPRMRFA